MRLRGAAADVDAAARELARAGDDVGLRGETGAALQHLVGAVAGELRLLAAACGRAADAERAVGERRP
ncbi:hypothetical protein ASD06_16730 [Angustibacter sp. Root456]|nr:hypothetical protein ASD06_16730 [Angustibacter sp. Root456]